ncbi:MAG: hypothetical protein K2O14_11520 [Oscillospiraceae bacterium]|nr:hypothetical protein [Oscillospiraceae bacterium]
MAIKFRSEEHENRFYEILARMGKTDEYHRAVAYLIALDTDCYKHVDSLYDFVEHGIKPWGALNQAWQTGTSVKTTRLIFNLWNTRCYDLDEDSREIKESARKYTVDEIFSSKLAFWYFEAVKLRYPNIGTEVE